VLEEVDGRETGRRPARVDQDEGAYRPVGDPVPHEPEAFLAGPPEQVEPDAAGEGQPTEGHGDRRGVLALDAAQVVHAGPGVGQDRLGAALHDPDGRSLSEARSAGMHRRRQQRPLLAGPPHPLIRGTAGGDEVGDQVEGAPRVRGRPRVTA
jgi:hypothetical protein